MESRKDCPPLCWYQLLRQLNSCLLVSTLPLLAPLFLCPSSLSETITAELRDELGEVTVGGLGYHREWSQAELMNTWYLIAVPVDCIFHHTRFQYSRASHAGYPVRNCVHQSTDAVKEAFYEWGYSVLTCIQWNISSSSFVYTIIKWHRSNHPYLKSLRANDSWNPIFSEVRKSR